VCISQQSYMIYRCMTDTQALETPPSAAAHLHLKSQAQYGAFCKPSKSGNFNMLYKNIWGVFCAKTSHTHTHTHTHTHSGDITSETYFTSCENGILPPL